MEPVRNSSNTVSARVMASITRRCGMVLWRNTTSSRPRRPSRRASSSTPIVTVLSPPAVEPDEPPISIRMMDSTAELSRRPAWSKVAYPAVLRVTD